MVVIHVVTVVGALLPRRRPGRVENGTVHVEQSHGRREIEEAGAHQHQNTRHRRWLATTQSLLTEIPNRSIQQIPI